MESKVINTAIENDNYPFLGKSKLNGLIVLFSEYECGTVLVTGPGGRAGFHSKTWIMENFTRLGNTTIEFTV